MKLRAEESCVRQNQREKSRRPRVLRQGRSCTLGTASCRRSSDKSLKTSQRCLQHNKGTTKKIKWRSFVLEHMVSETKEASRDLNPQLTTRNTSQTAEHLSSLWEIIVNARRIRSSCKLEQSMLNFENEWDNRDKRAGNSRHQRTGHICVWGGIGQAARHSTPVSGGTGVLSTANKRGRGRSGSGSRACRWWQDWRRTDKRNVQQRHVKRDGNECKRIRDTNSFSPWANAVCPRRTCAVLYELCTVLCAREKCASPRVRCCHWLSAKLRFSNFLKNLIRTRLDTRVRSVRSCFTHHCSDHLSSCQLCWRHLCHLGVHEDELYHDELGDQLDEEDGWWCSSAKCSAQFPTQGTLAVKDQSCHVNVSCHFQQISQLLFRFPVPWCLRWRWCLSVLVNTAWIKCVHISFSLLLRRIVEDTELYNVIQVPNPIIRPIIGKLRLPVDLVILPSVQDWSKSFVAFYSASWCVSSSEVMHLPQVRTACRTFVEIGNARNGAFRISPHHCAICPRLT